MFTSSSGCSLGGAGLCSYCTIQSTYTEGSTCGICFVATTKTCLHVTSQTLILHDCFVSQPNITIERCVTLNPATLLPTAEDGNPHDCVAETDKTMAARADLRDIPFPEADLTLFVDGSS